MTEDERLLEVLVASWRQAVQARAGCPKGQRRWWDGCLAGIAMSIAAASGLPPGGLNLQAAVQFGCEIARARPVPESRGTGE